MKRDLLTIRDLSAEEIIELISKARTMKEDWSMGRLEPSLTGKTVGLIFVKPSTRTRVSFEAAIHRLGGRCIFIFLGVAAGTGNQESCAQQQGNELTGNRYLFHSYIL